MCIVAVLQSKCPPSSVPCALLSPMQLPSSTLLQGTTTTTTNTMQDKASSLSPEGKDLEEKAGSEERKERLNSTDREKKTQFQGAESPADSDRVSPIKKRCRVSGAIHVCTHTHAHTHIHVHVQHYTTHSFFLYRVVKVTNIPHEKTFVHGCFLN